MAIVLTADEVTALYECAYYEPEAAKEGRMAVRRFGAWSLITTRDEMWTCSFLVHNGEWVDQWEADETRGEDPAPVQALRELSDRGSKFYEDYISCRLLPLTPERDADELYSLVTGSAMEPERLIERKVARAPGQIRDMICRYGIHQHVDQGIVIIGCSGAERYVDIVCEAEQEILAFFDSVRERRDLDEAKRGPGYIDCIPMLDRYDRARTERLDMSCPIDEDGQLKDFPLSSAWFRKNPELNEMNLGFVRVGEVPSSITVEWCRDFAADAAHITGLDICSVTVHTPEGKEAEYDVEKNILKF